MGSKKKTKTPVATGELNGMPERDEVGKAAMKYIEAIAKVNDARDNQDKCACALASAMRDAKRREIKIDGMLVKITHIDKDVIKVTKPKDK